MATLLEPRDEADLVDLVADARAARRRLSLEGRGTRRALGRPTETDATVSLAALSGITLYEPAELVMTARAATPLSEIRAALAAHGQELAFDPIEHAALFGHAPGSTSIAAAFALAASGPRRPKLGSARDHLLGFRAVNGLAESFKSGGRVMKNVTGFDLSKLVCGSFGTLAILSEVTFKVLPRPETEATVVVRGLADAAGCAVLREASGSPQEVAALAHLPAGTDPRFDGPATLLRLDGPAVSVESRKADLFARFATRGPTDVLDADASRALWADLREVAPLARRPGIVWRLTLAPSDGPAVVTALRAAGLALDAVLYDWAGGLLWLALAPASGAEAEAIRAAVDRVGGTATLVRADEATRRTVPVFHPEPPPLAALSARVKAAFDPDGLFEPGRKTQGV